MPALPGDARRQLLELQRLLAADDIAARECFHSLPPGCAASCSGVLARAIDDFDYETAGRLVARLLDEADKEVRT
jgi:hypothetical protein